MRCAVFSSKPYDIEFLSNAARTSEHELEYFEARLSPASAKLAEGFEAVCAFVNDDLQRPVLQSLRRGGTKIIALRCAGFNQLDLTAAREFGIRAARVPAYSPHAVAEHTLALILSLNRKIHKAYNRVRENNFGIDGLLGFDLHGRTVGVVGTGTIGQNVVRILHGFGCKVLMYDVKHSDDCLAWGNYCSLDQVLGESDIVTLHCPLNESTKHLINQDSIQKMKPGVMLVNTSRGGLVDTASAIEGLKTKQIGSLALDVYEEEGALFFEDLSRVIVDDDVFSRLLTFPNVLITSHQAFFTEQAMQEIARVTMQNLTEFEQNQSLSNAIC
jgi:D-lactate dehydrogenase